jgi:hypothetical protein
MMYKVGDSINLWILYLKNGIPQTGRTGISVEVVQVDSGTPILTSPLSEDSSYSGKYQTTWDTTGLSEPGDYEAHYFENSNVIGIETFRLDNTIENIQEIVNRIRNIEEGNWKIIGTQMIYYDITGLEMFRFNLKDSAGQPSNKDVFIREKV